MALHSELPIYKTGTDLLGAAYVIQRDMPRGFKRTLGEKIVQGCSDMLELMAVANATRHAERAAAIELPLAQLVEWIRDCLAMGESAERRGERALYADAVAELRVLVEEYQRRTSS